MTIDEQRQLRNVQVIRVSLAAALRKASPGQEERCIARARQLLTHARHEATTTVMAEIDALEAELTGSPTHRYAGRNGH